MKNRIRVRTLVIDDDASVCRRLLGWLDAHDHEVTTFTDPAGGLRHARETVCELALVDLRLPDRVGVEVIAELHDASPRTRVVAMSAFPRPDDVRRAIRAGARDVIEKPIRRLVLFRALDRQLSEIGISARTEQHFNVRLGARLRKLREGAGRAQQDVAHDVGISPAQLSQIELGKTATTTWTLARIASVLKLPLDSVLRDL